MIFDLFSKRQKKQRGELPDVFVYDKLPQPLRVQVVHIWREAFGDYSGYDSHAPAAYKSIHDALCREYGQFSLVKYPSGNYLEDLANFFLAVEDVEKALDVIELSFRYIDRVCREPSYRFHSGPKIEPDDAIKELNARFLEHGIGYAYESGSIVRKDSEVLHQEVVRPTLALLRDKRLRGANEEYLRALEHYRHGRNWPYKQTDNAKILLDICFNQGLLPSYLQSEFSALRSLLESGMPTVRNKTAGHGQGTQIRNVPSHLAAYALHLTGASILFLAAAERELP